MASEGGSAGTRVQSTVHSHDTTNERVGTITTSTAAYEFHIWYLDSFFCH